MVKKRDVVQRTKELTEMLTGVEVLAEGNMLLRSDQYLQLGCDLRDLSGLNQGLASAIDIENCQVLLVAEVSITYMNVEAADSLIQWAGKLPQGCISFSPTHVSETDKIVAQFCLLEQLLPDGIDHPFAKTMMAHFNKLQTPLRAVEKYPTKSAQCQRFKSLGWSNTLAYNLWELWSSAGFLSPSERSSLDLIEPFDEWEEFALFGCHYILLVANNVSSFPETSAYGPPQSPTISKSLHAEVVYSENANAHGYRRFSAVLPVRSPTGLDDRVGNFAGMGLNNRLASYDVYSTDTIRDQPFDFIGSSTPSSRMCHTITDMGDAGALLVGGRTSPDNALSDCWVYHKWPRVWERVDDLPQPRYRHSAIYLGSGSVLISPGRSDSRSIGSTFFIWNRQFGWKKCACSSNEMPRATYGATFTVFTNSSASEQSISGRGLLAGGISEDGVVQQEIWEWELQSSFLGQVSRITRFFFPHPELDNHPA